MSGTFLLRYTAWWFFLRGNAFIFIGTPAPGKGEPTELTPLPADCVVPLPGTMRQGVGVFANERVIDYEYTIGGSKQLLPGENVLHLRYPNPFDYWTGLSPLTAALLSLRTDDSQANWTADFFGKKNAIPSAIMSVPAETSESDFEIIRATLREQFEAGQRTLITRAGDLSVEVIQQTLEQMQVLGSREFNAKAIDRIYGIPEGMITGGLSGDSRLAAEIAFARNVIQPNLDYFAEEFSAQFGPYYGEDIAIVAPNVIPQDRALELQEYSTYGMDRTINENRLERGLEPLANEVADLVPVRLLQWVAPNYATLDGAEPEKEPIPPQLAAFQGQPPPPPPLAEDDEDEGQPGIGGQQNVAQEIGAMIGKARNGHDPVMALALGTELKRWEKVAAKEARAGRNPAVRAFESDIVPSELAAELRKVLDGADEPSVRRAFDAVQLASVAKATATDPLDAVKRKAEAELQKAFAAGNGDLGALKKIQAGAKPESVFGEAWATNYSASLAKVIRPVLLKLTAEASQLISQSMNVSFNLVNAKAQKWAEKYSFELVKGLTETTQTQLQTVISNWIASGEPMPKLIASLTDVFGNQVRAELIGATEVTRIYQQANEASWRQANDELDAGVVGGSWNTASDELVCETCAPLDGATRSLDSDGYEHPETGEILLMPAHPRCRCWEQPVLSKRGNAEGRRNG
jgi:HK97 family phage portal protein